MLIIPFVQNDLALAILYGTLSICTGAAFVILMEEEFAKANGMKPIARFKSFAVKGVHPGLMGMGPIEAIPKALEIAGVKLEDIDLIELNEAFASQALACIDTLGLNTDIVNVNGVDEIINDPFLKVLVVKVAVDKFRDKRFYIGFRDAKFCLHFKGAQVFRKVV